MVAALKGIFNQSSIHAIRTPAITSIHMGLETCNAIKSLKQL
jgi:hypothetical protein